MNLKIICVNELCILGIETSCDETSAAVVKGGKHILSNIISSQIEVHQKFGGVVPEVASRRHVENITPVIEQAIKEAGVSLSDLDAIAVTQGPGLVGSLLIGISAAKALAYALEIPLIGVHHIAGHIYSNHLVQELCFPLIALIASGGHTELIYMPSHNRYNKLGSTRDDAVGEAFDKVARLLKLPYPGGPQIEKLAKLGQASYNLPSAWLGNDSLDFSFSGLKSAVMNLMHNSRQRGEEVISEDLAATFQEVAVGILVGKAERALAQTGVRHLLLAGGVAANSYLRLKLEQMCERTGTNLTVPGIDLCTDNAAMIATAGTFKFLDNQISDLYLNADANLVLA